ncbi:MAG: DUF3987 domain-containing protein [Pyrinomonadaceae bacterium]|nr:DUF3987 domain-containing protein [Phycisphaerales bacterium]
MPGSVFEIRVLNCADRPGSTFTSTVSGYYQHSQIDTAVKHIVALDAGGTAPVIYVTLNPVNSALLARSTNRLKHKVKETTADKDILRRHWLLIDCDPVRPSGISTTDTELQAALKKAEAIRAFLGSSGWPEPVTVMSGNGVHLLYRIDLPVDEGGLVERVLHALAAKFDDGVVKIDQAVHNAARITKVAGTIAANKGDSMVGVEGLEDRPHRRAALLNVPESVVPVPVELLEALAATAPSDDPGPARATPRSAGSASSGHDKFERFDPSPSGVRSYLERHGVTIKSEGRDGASTHLYLDRCPVVADCQSTCDSDIAVIVGGDGRIGYKNLHNRGEGLGWLDVRDALEPGYKAWVASEGWKTQASAIPKAPGPWSPPRPLHEGPPPPPIPLEAAFPPALSEVRDFVAAVAEAIQVPLDLPAMLLLPIAGVCIAQKFEIELRPGWREIPALYILSLLESGERKSGTFSLMIAPILAWEREQAGELGPMIACAQEERKIKEGAQAELRKKAAKGDSQAREDAMELAQQLAEDPILSVPIIYTSEATSEGLALQLLQNQERGLVASPEADALDVMMGRYSEKGSPNMGIWLKGHSGDSERVVRRGRPPEYLDHPVLNVALAVQPESVRSLFASRAARGRGMLARILVSVPRSMVGHRKTGGNAEQLPDRLARTYAVMLRSLLNTPIVDQGPKIVRLDPEALALFVEFERKLEPELARGGFLGDRKDWGGKLCGAVARIALVLYGLQYARNGCCARSEGSAHLIDGATMKAALAWSPYLIDHERVVAATVGCDPITQSADHILGWIERKGLKTFSKRDAFIGNRSSTILKADDIEGPLNLLIELGYLRRQPDPVTEWTTGRPPSPMFIVNPEWKQGVRR